MNIVVCVKQIPDPAAPQSFDASNNLDRSGKLILDEADTYGVEMALQLVDKAGGGEVTVVSMGSASDVAGIRNALAMGAAKAVIVSDEALRGSDALATLAELLQLPSITFAKSVEIDGTTLKVERQTESGYDEVTAPLPCVVSVTAGVVEPRYASFKGIMAAKSKPLQTLSVSELGLDGQVGAAGAGQAIVEVVAAEARQSGEKFVDEGDGADKIVAFLESIKVL
ncbi:MAG: electron transfer flavoprotein subunit alpha [Actinobacteria bacterium 21-64-8]|nr:MAG: electron transfer flavoprotein subunit alpha [Actinobacteria bacterium 21-64-8]